MLIARVRRTLRERALIPDGSCVLVACSGGPDSAALLLALSRLAERMPFTLVAASVDHGLRAEAPRDVEIAARQAAQLSVPFHALTLAVAPGPSLQARARDARYAALTALAKRLGAARIAVGHTQDDQAETVLSRVLRGAGIRGLSAIDPSRADGVVRPLIDCSRHSTHRFAHANFPAVAVDASNHDARFERVRIRSHVLPALQAEDRALIRHLAELADEARDCDALIERLGEDLLERARVDPETLEISVLESAPPVLRRSALRRWLRARDASPLGRAELLQLDRTVRLRRGEVWISGQTAVVAVGGTRLQLRERAVGPG